jgi:large subunit ribosomal protein L44e
MSKGLYKVGVIAVLKLPNLISCYHNMKMQKELRKFCPKCKSHTVQAVSIYKKGKERKTAQGARRHAEDKKGYGGQKFPELKRTAKTTKKITLRYTCKNCQRKTMKEGMRMRKLEILP